MTATRVVIDVQPNFDAANKANLIVGVTVELMEAMRERAPILFVEFHRCPATHKSLTDLMRGYDKFRRVIKMDDDGGHEVKAALEAAKWPAKHLRVCGVNIDCCVRATVRTLLQELPDTRIELVKNACEWNSRFKYDWRTYTRHKNLKLV
jgi:nicotinamidase-related amidase